MEKIRISDNLEKDIKTGKEKCIGCKKCMKGCSMLAFYCQNPKDLFENLDQNKDFSVDMPYSCMLCGYCENICPIDLSWKDIFYKMRLKAVKDNSGRLPKGISGSAPNFHQVTAFSKPFFQNIKNLSSASDTVFFPGCGLMADNPSLMKEIFSYLENFIPNLAFWSACCGSPTRSLGREDLFLQRLKKIKKVYKKAGIKKIITGCENCSLVFKNHCEDLEVISLYSLLDRHFPNKATNKFREDNLTVAIQDPCPSRGDFPLYESVRSLVTKLGLSIEELEYCKNRSLCCSAGGSVPATRSKIAKDFLARRKAENGEFLVCYCRECEKKLTGDKKTDHILDLIFLEKSMAFTSHKVSTLQGWINKSK